MSILLRTRFDKNTGYYVNDNTASGGERVEDDIQTCKHCQRVLYKKAWLKNGGWCNGCQSPVCTPCATRMMKEGCKPYNDEVEKALESVVQLQQFRRMAGLDDPATIFNVSTGPDRR
jgi:hypothetical protein